MTLRAGCGAALALAFVACGSAPAASGARVATQVDGRPTLRVLSYNVNFGLEGDPETLDAIAKATPDIALLQETTPGWETALRARYGDEFAHVQFRHCCRAGGMAVLSKHAVVDQEEIQPPERGWFPAWRLVFDTPLGKLQVLNVHLRPQISESGSVVSGYFVTPAVREAEMKKYVGHLDATLPTLVVGDFNEGSGGQAIAVLERRGFRSAQSEMGSATPTWRWPTSVGTVRAELDHLAFDRRLKPLNVRVLATGRSDHLPVVGVFALADG